MDRHADVTPELIDLTAAEDEVAPDIIVIDLNLTGCGRSDAEAGAASAAAANHVFPNLIPTNQPDVGGAVESIMVQDSSMPAINGIYKRDGKSDGVSRYIKPENILGRVHVLARWPDNSWYISSVGVDVNGFLDPRIQTNYYVAENGLQQSMDPNVPPRIAWKPQPFLANDLKVIVYPHLVDLESSPLPLETRIPVVTRSPSTRNFCVICQEQFNEDEQEPRCQMNCCGGHCFHRLCLDRMFIITSDRCPLCRSYCLLGE